MKNNTVALNDKDYQIIKSFVPKLNMLKICIKKIDIIDVIDKLIIDCQYLTVSPKSDVYDIDKKINCLLDDCRIEAMKNMPNDQRIEDYIMQIRMKFEERKIHL